MKKLLLAAALLACAGCREPSPEVARAEAARFESAWRPHQEAYQRSLENAERTIADTLLWLNGEAVTAPRAQAVADAHMLMERWAKIHFVPRVIHEQLRFAEYRSAIVRQRQERLLARLRDEYVEWHDYQRYAQHAAETSMHQTPPGRLPPQLEELKRRLEGRGPVRTTEGW